MTLIYNYHKIKNMSRVKNNFFKIFIKIYFFSIIFTGIIFLGANVNAQIPPPSSCSASCPFDSNRICGTCPSGEVLCYPIINTSSCIVGCVAGCTELTLTGRVCSDGSPLNILVHTNKDGVSGSCSAGEACCCSITSLGACSGGWSGDTNGEAQLRNLVCPESCAPGTNFNITYEYRSTNYDGQVSQWQKVMVFGDNPVDGTPNWHTAGGYPGTCSSLNITSPINWQTVVKTIACSDLWEGYNTNPNLVVFGYNRDASASGFATWCDNSFPSSDAQLSCQVKKTIVSLGYLKLYHQGLGVIKLNLISVVDALSKSPFPGTVKVARFNGDTNSAADLVATSDPMASPVRIYTGLIGTDSPKGIWAWKKLP